jgi:hypothetical protein
MLKRLFNRFRRKPEKTVEEIAKHIQKHSKINPVENKEGDGVEHIIKAVTIPLSEIIEPNIEELELTVTTVEMDDIEVIEADEEEIKEFDVNTKFRFEVYVGMTESDVKLVNTHDFDNIEDAKAFGRKYVEKSFKDTNDYVIFVHEEVDGVLNRHY